jgi:glycosyltransferase involved in cell wall biosynthesis
VPAILTDGLNGLLVPCDNPEAAADAMTRLLDDDALARRLADAAFEGCARYQWSTVRALWLDLYRGLVGPRLATAASTA